MGGWVGEWVGGMGMGWSGVEETSLAQLTHLCRGQVQGRFLVHSALGVDQFLYRVGGWVGGWVGPCSLPTSFFLPWHPCPLYLVLGEEEAQAGQVRLLLLPAPALDELEDFLVVAHLSVGWGAWVGLVSSSVAAAAEEEAFTQLSSLCCCGWWLGTGLQRASCLCLVVWRR